MATRDLPKSVNDLFVGWVGRIQDEMTIGKSQDELINQDKLAKLDEFASIHSSDEDIVTSDGDDAEYETKVRMKNLWPAFASGAGLFSDGYVNAGISNVISCLKIIYGEEFTQSNAMSNIGSIAFVGTIIGQLGFGYISDRMSRHKGMLIANIMLIVFTMLCAVGSWGKTTQGFFACLTVWRFFLGIAIGSEYPTSSVIASEFANQLPAGHRNRYFSWFTNMMIDFGFVVASFVPLVLLWIFTPRHLRALWRVSIGLGVVPPLILFFIRLRMSNSKSFTKLNMKRVDYKDYPFWLIFKFYWFRLTIVSLIWFIYDFSVYSFGTFNTIIIGEIIPDGTLYQNWGWSVVFNLFYMPGSFTGAIVADYLGPRLTLALGVGIQGVIGIAMSACLDSLKKHIAGFVVVFGIFTTFGEFGPGNNTGLLASKTCATPIRGQYYGIAAAIGKIGAFVGTWVFPAIQKHYSYNESLALQVPFYISSALCLFSALLTIFFVPPVGQDAINKEDKLFLQYLRDNGFTKFEKFGDFGIVANDEENKVVKPFISEVEKDDDEVVVVHEKR
ncbi:Git4 protein [Candida orthopsilosis Co 90-125]|uniref:Git4 protein n=1 Tax=Candida orthopsilosis (strain 90-125) TaxID=1136231 RepID=H8X8Y9_CANO9|nr:Git4 protein [Candida orthopsilosis Co 90-125]CCG24287.1 Git4 protein [Candida orthopsilosis Co 90-125]